MKQYIKEKHKLKNLKQRIIGQNEFLYILACLKILCEFKNIQNIQTINETRRLLQTRRKKNKDVIKINIMSITFNI